MVRHYSILYSLILFGVVFSAIPAMSQGHREVEHDSTRGTDAAQASEDLLSTIAIPRFVLDNRGTLFIPLARRLLDPELLFFKVDKSFPRYLPLDTRIFVGDSEKRGFRRIELKLPDTDRASIQAPLVFDKFQVRAKAGGLLVETAKDSAPVNRSGWLLAVLKSNSSNEAINLFLVRSGKQTSQKGYQFGLAPTLLFENQPTRTVLQNESARRVCGLTNKLVRQVGLKDKKNSSQKMNADLLIRLQEVTPEDESVKMGLEALLSQIKALAKQANTRPEDLQLLNRQQSILCQMAWGALPDTSVRSEVKESEKADRQLVSAKAASNPGGGVSATITAEPNSTNTPSPDTPTPTHTPTPTPKAQTPEDPAPTMTPTPTPTSTRSPSRPPGGNGGGSGGGSQDPAEPPPSQCPKFNLKAFADAQDQTITATWKTKFESYLYWIDIYRVKRNEAGEIIQGEKGPMVFQGQEFEKPSSERLHRENFDIKVEEGVPFYDTYLVYLWERDKSPNGKWIEECAPAVVEMKCPDFEEPTISKTSDVGPVVVDNLRIAKATEVMVYRVEGELPELTEYDGPRYRSAESKACDKAEDAVADSEGSRNLLYSQFIKEKVGELKGPFDSDEAKGLDLNGSGTNHLVCIHLCPYCASKERFDTYPDAKTVAKLFKGTASTDSFADQALVRPEPNQVMTSRTFLAYGSGGQSDEGSTAETVYTVTVWKDGSAAPVYEKQRLALMADTVGPFTTGQYTLRFDRKIGRAGTFGTVVPFEVKLPEVVGLVTDKTYSSEPEIAWRTSEGEKPTGYELFISKEDAFSPLVRASTKEKSHKIGLGKLPPGRYDVWIRSTFDDYTSPWADTPFKYTVVAPESSILALGAPRPEGEEGTEDQGTCVPFQLAVSSDYSDPPREFKLWIKDVMSGEVVFNQITDATPCVPGLVAGQNIAVSVRALVAGSNNNWLTKWSKTAKEAIPALVDSITEPGIIEPIETFTKSLTPTFMSIEVTGATKYEFWISEFYPDTNKVGKTLLRESIDSTSFTVPSEQPLSAGTSIKVWVRAYRNGAWTKWQTARVFRVFEG
jgi:hypothetical protein